MCHAYNHYDWISCRGGSKERTHTHTHKHTHTHTHTHTQAYNEPTQPEKHFPAFFGLFVLLFATTGIANGSTFRQISVIFMNIGQPEQAGPVLGWSSAIASYGAAIIPG